MTTPSKLSLKKKIRQKLESGSRNDGEAEKENVPRCADNLSDRFSRRCSTIIAGNLGLGAIIRTPGSRLGVLEESGKKRESGGGNRLGVLAESGERRESRGGMITEDESSFYSCPEPDSPADEDSRRMILASGAAVEDTWMTEVTEREHKVVTTPGNQSRIGQFPVVS